jgi:hypothetical protein
MGVVVPDAANETTGAVAPAEEAAGNADSADVAKVFVPPEFDPLWLEPSEEVPPDGETAEASAARASKPWLLLMVSVATVQLMMRSATKCNFSIDVFVRNRSPAHKPQLDNRNFVSVKR